MTSNFRDFEADYHSHLDSIKKDVEFLHGSFSDTHKRDQGVVFNRADVVKRLQEHHGQLKEAVALMELESNEGTQEQRMQCKLRLADMKREAFRLEKEINSLKAQAMAADRADLVKRAGTAKTDNSVATKTDTQLAQMSQNTKTMTKGTTTLKQALQYVVRMNEHGEAVIVELKRQDETIDRITGTTANTDSELTATQRVLRGMRMGAMKNQVMLSGVVIVLIVMIVALLYYEYARPSSLVSEKSSPGAVGSGDGVPAPPPSVINSPVRPPEVAPPGAAASSSVSFRGALDGFAPAPAGLTLQPLFPN